MLNVDSDVKSVLGLWRISYEGGDYLTTHNGTLEEAIYKASHSNWDVVIYLGREIVCIIKYVGRRAKIKVFKNKLLRSKHGVA